MFRRRSSIEDVFTPRRANVNPDMYIERPHLERSLKRALRGTFHVVVHGESGGGKSWLYKKVLADMGAKSLTANCANCVRFGSIADELRNLLSRTGQSVQTSFDDSVKGSANAGIVSGESGRVAKYHIGQKEPLEAVLEYIREQANGQLGVLVFDNLESIVSSETLMRELANIIILLDDERYASYEVKIVIVGVPANVKQVFAMIENLSTVANRLQEIAEVSRLSKDQVDDFVRKGFVNKLKISLNDELLSTWQNHIYWVTDGTPQRLHEFCLELAYCCEDNDWQPTHELLSIADQNWLSNSLIEAYSVIEEAMNDRSTKIGRRDQVLFTLGTLDTNSFGLSEVEVALRNEFPLSTDGVSLGIAPILYYLSGQSDSGNKLQHPILTRTIKGDAYRFANPIYLMCIRSMLKKNDEKIHKVDLKDV